MTAASLLHGAAALWWACALLALALSFIAGLCFPRPRPRGHALVNPPPVTAIVPVKELDRSFAAAQASLFCQEYPNFEVLIASAERKSAALNAANQVQAAYSAIPSRTLCSTVDRAVSPKLNNLWLPVAEAKFDLILTKDSNVVLGPGDLDCFVRHFTNGVGLVSAVPIVTEPQSLAAWVEASIVNNYFARMLMLARALGMGFGCGKIMLFRRSDIERAGGIQSLAWALGEDAALTDAVAQLGLRTVLADRVTIQPLGPRRWKEVWNRQLRWRLIWRVQVPVVFAASLFGSALLAALAGAVAAPILGYTPFAIAATTLALWFFLESALCLVRGWALSPLSPVAFLCRELLDILVWLRALTTSEVTWAGATYKAGKPDTATKTISELTPVLRQDAGGTRDRL